MRSLYEGSKAGLDIPSKQLEFEHPDSRFIILRTLEEKLVGFVNFRFDWEETMEDEDVEVLYCYELQVSKEYQGFGAGRLLADLMEGLAKQWRMKKVMLTVFRANVEALAFYNRCSYDIDEISPSRVDGAEEAEYEIMSKEIVS
ncbi:hypothetical protein BT69DRAFT_586111 [Atractiella rhizophila]|nr:hypothetical protein BT69DRAFT_586111 [Atractiella rhizophila]